MTYVSSLKQQIEEIDTCQNKIQICLTGEKLFTPASATGDASAVLESLKYIAVVDIAKQGKWNMQNYLVISS